MRLDHERILRSAVTNCTPGRRPRPVDFPALFKASFDRGASDIHLRAGRTPTLRIHGGLVPVDAGAISSEEFLSQLRRMVPESLRDDVVANVSRGLDFSYT